MNNKPYTYLIGWSTQDFWYYGVRYAQNCNPDDLWVSYFTSSKYVKEARYMYGDPDVIQIRKTFNDQKNAVLWETKVLKRLKVLKSDKWLNKNVAGKMNPGFGKENGMFGKKHTDEVKQRLSIASKGVNNNQIEGYFITPWGKFDSAPAAASSAPEKITSWSINRWCKKDNNMNIIKTSRSKIIQINNIDKTYQDIGFGFEIMETIL
jgi:hypothetical protein